MKAYRWKANLGAASSLRPSFIRRSQRGQSGTQPLHSLRALCHNADHWKISQALLPALLTVLSGLQSIARVFSRCSCEWWGISCKADVQLLSVKTTHMSQEPQPDRSGTQGKIKELKCSKLELACIVADLICELTIAEENSVGR